MLSLLTLLLLTYGVLSQSTEENNTSSSFTNDTNVEEYVPPPFTPNEKDSIPRNRAKHPVLFTGKTPKGFLNFCESPDGFNLTRDITKDCFYKPYVESVALPSLFMLVVIIVLTLVIYVLSCARCCFGPCCVAKHGCICPKDEKSYGNMQWCSFIVINVVVFTLLVPFIVLGIFGNSKTTVAFKSFGNTLFDTYDQIKNIFDQTTEAFVSIDLEPLKQTVPNLDTSIFDQTKEALNSLNKQVRTIDGTVNLGRKYISSVYIAREALVDVILLLPIICIVLYFIGAICKCHFLTIPMFPTAIVFAVLSMILVAIEYPMVTVTSDVCTYMIDEMSPEKQTGSSQLEQVFQIVRNCQNSTLQNMTDSFETVQKDIIKTALDFYGQICTDEIVNTGDFVKYDEKFTCTGVTNNNTACVAGLNQTIEATTNPMYCPRDPQVDSFDGILKLMDSIFIKNFMYYFIDGSKTDQSALLQPVRCEFPAWQNSTEAIDKKYIITPIACKYPSNITINNCDTECPENFKNYSTNIKNLKSVADSLVSIINLINQEVLPLIKCPSINRLLTNLKEATCYELISVEPPLMIGLLGYSAVLLLIFVVGLLSIKRFKKSNYDYVDDNPKYFSENEMLEVHG
ncbi:hypothetical protein EIN_153690 [Entamoeba invadens IP1]|uniref:Uncharacterized protein n=1 Tax=Entamoeba invadens IP1 TaxID=370355 RepID=A0A0A1U905_ENTIV|nr:hypothetical protein EIN_153690 [Entamoeba invadens IP1]ELP91332.1 hypothetical protein EIN_153690 [Entamoeba invadens IP1]|eukprot:XP_004258103.1 hypothetical protein EIN_153690 [Entamoeba invadens IP1]